MKPSTRQQIDLVTKTIYKKKGRNILALDVRGLSSITDFLIIAEGNVHIHVISIAKEVINVMSEAGITPVCVEGLEDGEWVVLDFTDFMVHLFVPTLREKYQLERLWPQSNLLDLNLPVEYEQAIT